MTGNSSPVTSNQPAQRLFREPKPAGAGLERSGRSRAAESEGCVISRIGASGWAGEKLVLHKLRFHPDFVAPFSPPCEGGVRGGWSRHDQSQGLPMLSPSQSFRIPLARREVSFPISKAPASPPLPPLRKGGKGIARSRRRSIARNKNTRLETVPPARSTPTFHRPGPDHAGAGWPRR